MYDLKDKLSNLSEKIRSDMIPTLHEKEKKRIGFLYNNSSGLEAAHMDVAYVNLGIEEEAFWLPSKMCI